MAGKQVDDSDLLPNLPNAGGSVTGPVGTDSAVTLVDRIIARVVKDWDSPNPNTTPWVEVPGATLADVGAALDANDEWGQGGGRLRSDRIPVGTSTNLTIQLHGNLQRRVARWRNYATASAAAKAEWDRMIGKLTAHEQRHMDIAIEEFDKVAADLVGKDIDQIVSLVTAANAAAETRQHQLDTSTDHGSRRGVTYGDVFLDTSIT